MTPTVETITGKIVHLLNPHPGTIVFEDIAYPLSRIARYNGHTMGNFQYSVAQHSVWCAWVAQQYFKCDADSVVKVLLHDAHEAYTGDVVTPLKKQLEVIESIQERLQDVIHESLAVERCNTREAELIAIIDKWALAVEAKHLMRGCGRNWKLPMVPDVLYKIWREPVAPMQAYRMFVDAFSKLRSGMEMLSPCA